MTTDAEPAVDPTEATLPIPGKEPVFRHMDDPEVPWQLCRAQRNADGSEAYVREKWFSFSPDPQYLSLYAEYDPGMMVRRHGHHSPHIVFVIAGGLWFADRWCPAGTHVELPYGAAFGPVRAGDEGAKLFEVMMGDPRSWEADREEFHALLAERGVTQLPNPPVQLPEWLADTRSDHTG